MDIRVHKLEQENTVSIHTPNNFMPQLTNFLLADNCYDLPRIEPNSGETITKGSPYTPETQETITLGYIECVIKQGSINELVEKMSSEFNLEVLNHGDKDWTLRS